MVRVRSRHFNGRQPNGLNKNILSDSTGGVKSSSWVGGGGGGGLMRGIKIPMQDFPLKMPGGGGGGGLCARVGRICGTLRYIIYNIKESPVSITRRLAVYRIP